LKPVFGLTTSSNGVVMKSATGRKSFAPYGRLEYTDCATAKVGVATSSV
jgi:hypothetical protein